MVTNSSVIVVQLFDQKKFKKKKDQGFLGTVNILMHSILDVYSIGDGTL